ncbi:hypothetical protein BLA60_12930 [Actinophytocola xinjiangensis]|uniref:Uncharacterized protein n=1 Tax=Actinophytocola xinjiangensis TaxID=485602 RepID=A0A7Z0WNE6_9PSEU|nr:hypothetical protein [Actinophytocola xinjiangensis]OLF10931.1 hypothetical protein BLA60_12930 [Actinophytocola xinjiangensis]
MTLITDDEPPVTAETELKYVLLLAGAVNGTDETVTTLDVTGTVGELTVGLRPWLLATLRSKEHTNGWYIACLVTVNHDRTYDTYLSLAMESTLWFWDEECVPISQARQMTRNHQS